MLQRRKINSHPSNFTEVIIGFLSGFCILKSQNHHFLSFFFTFGIRLAVWIRSGLSDFKFLGLKAGDIFPIARNSGPSQLIWSDLGMVGRLHMSLLLVHELL